MRFLRVLALIGLCVSLPAHAEAGPADTVNTLHDALLQNMKQSDQTPCAKRIETMRKVVSTTFDMPFLAQFVVRKEWKQLSDAQQRDFTDALTLMTASNYGIEFHGYSGEKFEAGKVEDLGKDKKVVRTKLVISPSEHVTFDYMLRQTNGSWRIINVIANGVSDIAIRSAQYDRVIKDKGFDALVAQLKAQNEKMAKDCRAEKN
jgi:phospholipid transport system substrate-binding protein